MLEVRARHRSSTQPFLETVGFSTYEDDTIAGKQGLEGKMDYRQYD